MGGQSNVALHRQRVVEGLDDTTASSVQPEGGASSGRGWSGVDGPASSSAPNLLLKCRIDRVLQIDLVTNVNVPKNGVRGKGRVHIPEHANSPDGPIILIA